jgi:hypothetical protein
MTSRVRTSILALTFSVIIALPSIASAQSTSTPTVGVKAGVNGSKLSFDDDFGFDVRPLWGLVGGLFVDLPIADKVGVRVEGLYSQKGAKAEDLLELPGPEAKFRLTYIDVPVLLSFGGSASDQLGINVFTGPQLSFKLNAEQTFLGTTEDIEDIKGTDLGWVLGAGLSVNPVTVEARYTHGFTNIATDGGTVKNRVFSLTLGVRFK